MKNQSRSFRAVALCGLLVLAFSHSKAVAHTSYTDTVHCPLDGTAVPIEITMSMTTTGGTHDFQSIGYIGNYYQALIVSCPRCGYAGFQTDFDTTFPAAVAESLRDYLSRTAKHTLDDVEECERCAELYGVRKLSQEEVAHCYLIGSYLLRTDTVQTVRRKRIQNAGARLLEEAAKTVLRDSPYVANLYYLAADLYRRADKFDDAIRLFELARNAPRNDDDLLTWIDEQRKLAEKHDDRNDI
jgi:hypothetical protein